jgi:hypothetical protein
VHEHRDERKEDQDDVACLEELVLEVAEVARRCKDRELRFGGCSGVRRPTFISLGCGVGKNVPQSNPILPSPSESYWLSGNQVNNPRVEGKVSVEQRTKATYVASEPFGDVLGTLTHIRPPTKM